MHIPVLLHEVIRFLEIHPNDTVLDGTVGGASHSEAIGMVLSKKGTLICLDQDRDALTRAKARLKQLSCRVIAEIENFRNLDTVLARKGIKKVNRILLDVGLSSDQLETSGRGFSFKRNEPLLMTFKSVPREEDITAQDILRLWSKESIREILRGFGEERFAGRIAEAIVVARTQHPIETTTALAEIVTHAVPARFRHGAIHPATKTFQALRIAVNDELGALKEGLTKGFAALTHKGRMAVISFHSGEDRIVKTFFAQKEREGFARRITKKPVIPAKEELNSNRRARSAKLRIIEKL